MTFKERLFKIIELKGFKSISSFERHVGFSNGTAASMINPTNKTLEKILNSFPDINPVWLQFGQGDIYLAGDGSQNTLHKTTETTTNNRLKTFSNLPVSSNNKIPFYDIDFMAGSSEIFNDGKEVPSHYMDIQPFNDCDFALPIFGDSMFPIYQNGDIVLCREIKDKSIIPLGEAFLIVTAEHRLLKYLKKGPARGILLAVSENNHYEPFEIPIDSIKKLYIVKGVIKRKTI